MNVRRRSRRSFRTLKGGESFMGVPKYKIGDKIGNFEITFYHGHSAINKRTAKQMAKPQHWYRCKCSCGGFENRSQQELIDNRREQKCYICRNPNPEIL